MAASTCVRGPHSAATAGATAASAGPLTATIDQVLQAQRGRIVAGLQRHGDARPAAVSSRSPCLCTAASVSPRASVDSCSVPAAGGQAAAQPAGEEAADGAETDDADFHGLLRSQRLNRACQPACPSPCRVSMLRS